MPIDACKHTFAEMATTVLPAYMEKMRFAQENTKPGYVMTTDSGTEPELRARLMESGMQEPDIERLFKQAS